jgi:acetolactate synthase-1/2/3 large subunit
MLQAPVLGYRRGRGVLDSRNPLSVTLPLGRELWGEADAVLAVGTRLLNPMNQWGIDKNLQVVRVDADPENLPGCISRVALVGNAAPILDKTDRRTRQIQHAPRITLQRNAGAPGEVA